MEKAALKDIMFGGVLELSRNSRYYYRSAVGESYSHWTEDGKEALQSLMDNLAWKLLEAEEVELNKRSKDLVLKGLKGEKI